MNEEFLPLKIGSFSDNKKENEVLFAPLSYLCIEQIKERSNFTVIKMKYLCA
jgi:hypothetical protein